MDRRRFVRQGVQAVAAATAGGLLWNALLRAQSAQAMTPLRPPGAQDEHHFLATCIKCGLCVQACPFATLKLARFGEAVASGTPYFVPRDVPCLMCTDIPCVRVCPTGSLDRDMKDIAAARMGLAVIDPESCLSWQGLRCEVCFRVCPVQGKAITIAQHPRQTSRHAMLVPVVHSDACTGCGICEKRCPTEVAAIRINDPKRVQGKLGAHYRIDGKAETVEPAAAESRKSSPLDYLNRGGDR